MRTLPFCWVDVFTDALFGGNQLAVYTDGRGLDTATMQAIAREMNLSETTFVLAPADRRNDYRVRIFTPGRELPMAGHPTVGTTFVLQRKNMVQGSKVRLEEGVGPIEVTLEDSGLIWMRQLSPKFGPEFADRGAIAQMLSLPENAIEPDLPLEVVSCGVPFLFVPLRTLDAVRSIRIRADVWQRALEGFPTHEVFVFTRETEAGGTVHSRMFAPDLGIMEDPATGAASGPLGCYLVRHGLVPRSPRVEILSEQGFEIGRRSFIHIVIESSGGEISGVHVGGRCRFVAEGTLELPDTNP